MRGPNRPPDSGGRGGRGRRWGVGLLVVTGLLASIAATTLATGCSPRYVLRAGWEEAKILNGRRSLPEVILDPATDAETRGKLTLAYEAREFARDSLLLDVGDSYTTYTELERDTLAMVLSAARSDSLAPVTWWFPIVGHVPYRGFFDLADAEREQLKPRGRGVRHLPAPDCRLQHPGLVLRPPPLDDRALRRGGAGRDDHARTRAQPPLRRRPDSLQRELRDVGGTQGCDRLLLQPGGRRSRVRPLCPGPGPLGGRDAILALHRRPGRGARGALRRRVYHDQGKDRPPPTRSFCAIGSTSSGRFAPASGRSPSRTTTTSRRTTRSC